MARKRSKTKPKVLKTAQSNTAASGTSGAMRDQDPTGGCATMQSEPFHSDVTTDTAVIHPVTPEILDEVAHKAAQLADDVAHHPEHHPDAPAAAVQEAPVQHDIAETTETLASEAADTAGHLVDGVVETAHDVEAGAEQAATEAAAATGAAIERSGAVLAEATAGAARASSDVEERLSGAGDAIGRYNAALFGMIRTNVAATGELFAALVKARSVPEALAINADHLRRQFDTMTAQGRELAQLAQTLAFDTLKPPAGTTRRDA